MDVALTHQYQEQPTIMKRDPELQLRLNSRRALRAKSRSRSNAIIIINPTAATFEASTKKARCPIQISASCVAFVGLDHLIARLYLQPSNLDLEARTIAWQEGMIEHRSSKIETKKER